MKIEKIWSAVENRDIEVSFTDEEHAALAAFVTEHAESAEWFTPNEVDELLPEEHQASDDFDTADIVRPFLPEGFGVEQHGFEDFVITNGESEDDEDDE